MDVPRSITRSAPTSEFGCKVPRIMWASSRAEMRRVTWPNRKQVEGSRVSRRKCRGPGLRLRRVFSEEMVYHSHSNT